MKRKIASILLVAFCFCINAQISLVNTFSSSVTVFKTHNNGYKMYEVKGSPLTFYIYNLNNTLFNSFAIPTQTFATPNKVGYVSQNLFDLDAGMEYFVFYMVTSTPPLYGKFYIYNEDGTVLFYRDSAVAMQNVYYHPHALNIADFIYHDGVSTKMKITVGLGGLGAGALRNEVYSLPGTIPCVDCSAGNIAGFAANGSSPEPETAKFYPNPATDQLKLNYHLPEGVRQAEIKIHDIQGKLIDELKVTDSFEFIYLPVNFNNGMYLYSLVVDGRVIKTEKIILNK